MRRASILVLAAATALWLITAGPAIGSPPPRMVGLGPGVTDFNGDGFAEVAVTAYDEGVGAASFAGSVNVLYGSAAGLQASSPDDQVWNQNVPGVKGAAEAGEHFGYSLGAADFNGDGFTDLAIGVPWEDVGAAGDAGAVSVLYGSAGGLQAASPDDQLWTQDSPGVKDAAEAGDLFGYSVGAGDFNGDGFADLSAGAPFEDVGAISNGGAVSVLYGSAGGLQAVAPDDQLWTQDSPGVKDTAEVEDYFGSSTASGDYNADGFTDMAAGTTNENLGAVPDAGAIGVLYGSAGGLQAASPDDQLWHQNSPGVEDLAESGDFFSLVLGSGDFNADTFTDLAAGVPFEDVGAVFDAGAANVLYGSAVGLQADSPNDQFWTQDPPEVQDMAEGGDGFGWALSAGDFDGDGFDDLAAGVPEEDVGTIPDAGAVSVLYGSAGGLQATSPDDQLWTQNSPGVQDGSGDGDVFGNALKASDFNLDGFTDLGIGVYLEDLEAVDLAGAVSVLYGGSTGLQASSPDDQFWTQDSPGVKDVAEFNDEFGWSLV